MFTRIQELKTLAMFSRSMAACLNAGFPASKALSASSARLPPSQTARALHKEAMSADSNLPLSEILKASFPSHLRAILFAGESSGRLAECFEKLASFCSKLVPPLEAARKLWLYPLLIIGFGWVIQAGILIHHGQGRLAVDLIARVLCAVLFVIAIPVACRKIGFMRRWVDLLFIRTPIVGDLTLMLCVNFFLQSFGLLYRSGGMHVTRMLAIAEESVPNSVVRRDVARIRTGIDHLDTLSEALSRPRLLPVDLRDLLVTGALSGRLEASIESVFRISSDRLDVTVAMVLPVISKMTAYLVIGSIVATLALVLR